MTEKRFTIKHYESQDWAYGNGEPIYTKDMVELLNELHEENMCLKGEVAHYKLILMSLEEEAKRITENWKVRK